VVNYGRDEDDNIIQDFLWNTENYMGKNENFMGTVGSQGTA
jgi:hypothetical protein